MYSRQFTLMKLFRYFELEKSKKKTWRCIFYQKLTLNLFRFFEVILQPEICDELNKFRTNLPVSWIFEQLIVIIIIMLIRTKVCPLCRLIIYKSLVSKTIFNQRIITFHSIFKSIFDSFNVKLKFFLINNIILMNMLLRVR